MIKMVVQMFNDGGSFMWVILGVMAVACAVVLERGIYLFVYCRGSSYNIVNKMIASLELGKPDDARLIVAKKTAPMFVLLRAALDRYVSGRWSC